jgi:hypothetical protein
MPARLRFPIAVALRAGAVFLSSAAAAWGEPAASETAPASGASEAGSTPAPAVSVSGTRPEPGKTTLAAEDARRIPGALGDPLRSVELLPGVVPVRSSTPLFFLRGAPPANTGLYVDDLRVPTLFHAGLGPSVVHPELLDRIDVFPGTAPARFGGVAGGVLSASLAAPPDEPHADATVRLVDASALVAAPFLDGRGTLTLAGRYGYPDFALGLISPSTRLEYADAQARVTWSFGPRDRASLLWLGSSDDYGATSASGPGTALTEIVASRFQLADLRYEHVLGGGGSLRLDAVAGTRTLGAAPLYAGDRSGGARVALEQQLSSTLSLRAGGSFGLDAYRLSPERGSKLLPIVPSSANPPPEDVTAGGYVEVSSRLAPDVELTPGARADLYRSSRSGTSSAPRDASRVGIDPRLVARARLADGLVWVGSIGVAHQFPVLRLGTAPASVASVPGFASRNARLQTTYHSSQGIEARLPWALFMTATVFVDTSTGLTDLTAECRAVGAPGSSVPARYDCADDAVRGSAHGLEVLLRRSLTRRLGGFVSYTLSRTTRDARFRSESGDTVARVPSEYDRPHVFNAAIGYDAGRRWTLGARVTAYSGQPYLPTIDGAAVPEYGARRLPAFFRADVRAEKRWPMGADGWVSLSLEVQNVTFAGDATGLQCKPSTRGALDTCSVQLARIVIPILGLEASI